MSMSFPGTRKSIVQNAYGLPSEVLSLSELPTPQIKDNEILINISAASVNPVDWKLMKGLLSIVQGRKFPRVPCFDFAGVVVHKGTKTSDKFKIGDKVYGDFGPGVGSLTTYAATVESNLAKLPSNLSFEQAAAVPLVSLTSYQAITQHAQVQMGSRVLIIGASSATGCVGVQIAKLRGASVVGVCSGKNSEKVLSYGAIQTIDYTKEQFGSVLKGQNFDVVYDCVGGYNQWVQAQMILKNGGIFVTISNDTTEPANAFQTVQLISGIVYRKARSFLNPHHYYVPFLKKNSQVDLEEITKMIEAGDLKVPVEKVYPMEEYRDMFERSQSGRATGKLVMRIQ